MEELQDNMTLLLECLHYQQDSISSLKQALTTIASMCITHDHLCDHFRAGGGLQYVTQLLMKAKSTELQISLMYCLGCCCEHNVASQKVLCNQTMFAFLQDLFIVNSVKTVKLTAAFFITCLMNGNVAGQNLAREMHILESLMILYKQLHPHENKPQCTNADSDLTEDAKLWVSISSAICTAANNPQNEINQDICSQILPAALSIFSLASSFPISFVRSAATVISACTANNSIVQERLRLVGGLQICVEALQAFVFYGTNVHRIDVVAHIVKIIFTATADNLSCKTLAMLDIASLLLKILQITSLDESTKLNIVICLGIITEGCEKSQATVRELGLPILISMMANSKNDELLRTTTLVIKSCVEKTEIVSVNNNEDAEYSNKDMIAKKSFDTSHLNKMSLKALDEKKLPLKDNVVQWLTTSGCVGNGFGERGVYQQQGTDPTHVTAFPSVTVCEATKLLQIPVHSSLLPQNGTHFEFQVNKVADCSQLNRRKKQYSSIKSGSANHRGILHELQVVRNLQPGESDAIFSTPLFLQHSSKPNVRYSTRHQQLNHIHSKLLFARNDIFRYQISKSTSMQYIEIHSEAQCLGCTPSKSFQLTSRNFRFQLQNDVHTCVYHKQLLSISYGTITQAQAIENLVGDKNLGNNEDQEKRPALPHEYASNIKSCQTKLARYYNEMDISMMNTAFTSCKTLKCTPLVDKKNCTQPPNQELHYIPTQIKLHVKFTEDEIQNLILGIQTLGKRWHYILAAYPFNPCRTPSDLKDQYCILNAKGLIN